MKMENVEDIYPLSPIQAGMLYHSINDPTDKVYVEQYSCTLDGPVDAAAFRKAWETLVQRHAILRTAIFWEGLDEPMQVVRRSAELPWREVDLRPIPREQRAEKLDAYLRAEREEGFKLSSAPLIRVSLVRTDEARYRFVWMYHHMLTDVWSTAQLLKEAFTCYAAYVNSTEPQPSTPPPYRDYIAYLKHKDPAQAKRFWEEALEGFTTPTTLPVIDGCDPKAERRHTMARQELDLTPEQADVVRSAMRETRLTFNNLLQGAWAVLLGRYTGDDDVVFGATVTGRPVDLRGVQEMVGPFINTLPIRARLDPDQAVRPWLDAMQSQQMRAMDFQHTALVDVQGYSRVPRGTSLFDTIVVVEGISLEDPISELPGGVTIGDVHYEAHSNYPLALIAMPGDPMKLILIHDRRRLGVTPAKRMLGHVATLLTAIARDPQQTIADLPMLTEQERRQLVQEWNLTECPPPPARCLHHLFERQADLNPDAPAVVGDSASLSYAQLDGNANRLARHLHNQGVGPGSLVGICVTRSPRLLVGLLGILKAGGAYVPLDPEYPRARLQGMIEDAGVSVVVTERGVVDRLPEQDVRRVMLDEDREAIGAHDDSRPDYGVGPDDPAYVIFTSGSTGRPAGVLVRHRNAAYSTFAREVYYADAPSRFLMLSSYAFDSSVAGLFWPLATGGAVCLPAAGRHTDPAYLGGFIREHTISHLLCVPPFYRELLYGEPDAIGRLAAVIVAGEACMPDLVRAHLDAVPQTKLYNEYGPTEATVWCTVHACGQDDVRGTSVPIGRPIPGAEVYLLDRERHPVPTGVPGEMYVGGPGITAGYVNRPELTAERFVASPFDDDTGAQLYKTGDLAKYRADGTIEFIGRVDHQVKVHGYRVELGEIEAALAEHPTIVEAVVLADDGSLPMPSADDGGTPADRQPASPDRDDEPADAQRWTRRDSRYNVTVGIRNGGFIQPPRDSQRQWLVNQLLNECADDLEHLDKVAKRFVPGDEGGGMGHIQFSQDGLSADEVMETWQTPVMRAMAEQVTETHGDVLEIGFGRGVSASIIQEMGVRSHTIVEPVEDCIKNFFEPWKARYPGREIRLVRGKWQDVLDQLGKYDGVFFHAVPLDEQEFIDHMVNSVTFAEHVFPTAAQLLKAGGAFSYFTTEIDSFSRRHQRALFEHFSKVTLSVQPLSIPEDTKDMWWADSMVIVKAVR